MSWGFSFQLLPGEDIIEDSTKRDNMLVKPAYSVFLTNQRVIFRFDGLGSSLTKSFLYNEIIEAKPSKRVFVNYLLIKTKDKEYLLNTSEPEYWSKKISNIKGNFTENIEDVSDKKTEGKKGEFLNMLIILRNNALLTEEEFEEKIRMLNSLKL
jgi:hypothetical protein